MKKLAHPRSLLLLLAIALLIAGCTFPRPSSTPATTTPTTTAPATTTPATTASLYFKPRGQYNMPGFGEKFVIHHFNEVDIVVYEMFFYDASSLFLLGENAGKNGDSYATVNESAMLIGISEKYWLFEKTPGGERLAWSLEEYTTPERDRLYHVEVPWEELSQAEKDAFIYISDTELCFNPYFADN